jgi:hypothetical protein
MLVGGDEMQRLVASLLLSLLVLSSFGFVFAGDVWEKSNIQPSASPGTCNTCNSCQDFDIDKALSEVNAKIENLTRVINQKEAELQGLYVELNKTKSVGTLEKIIKLEDEVQGLKIFLATYKADEERLIFFKRYTRKTPYGLQILYYQLPMESEVLKEYIEKVKPVREDVDLEWFQGYYLQAKELIMYKRALTDVEIKKKLEELKKDQSNINDEDIQYILKRLDKMKVLQEKLNTHIIDSTILDEYIKLRTLGRQQVIKSQIITPLSTPTNYGGLPIGYSCGSCATPKPILSYDQGIPGEHTLGYATFYNLQPIGVWVGMYLSSSPDEDYYWGMYCTEYFPSTNSLSTIKAVYWEHAVDLAYDISPEFGEDFENSGSIQIKFFYDGTAYNYFSTPNEYQVANLIYQYNCNKNGCYKSRILRALPSNPQYHPTPYSTELYIYVRVLACCNGGLVGSSCKWANRHCSSCFAPDESKSQNFPYEG